MSTHLVNVMVTLLILSSGCAGRKWNSYVIVGLDYRDVKAIIAPSAGTNIYVDLVTRNPDRTNLIAKYFRLDNQSPQQAAIKFVRSGFLVTRST